MVSDDLQDALECTEAALSEALERITELEQQLADVLTPMPDRDEPPQGHTIQQANAWCLVHKAAIDVGMLSFLDRLDSTGAERVAAFIKHLANQAVKPT